MRSRLAPHCIWESRTAASVTRTNAENSFKRAEEIYQVLTK